MIAYASRTGTRRNLEALRRAGWRLLVSATGVLRSEGFRYCLDNGAWTWHQKGAAFCSDTFKVALRKMGPGADFVVCPDIVEGGHESLRFSLTWLRECLSVCRRVLIPVQDGMDPASVSHHFNQRVGIFVGGSTEYKEATMGEWGRVARKRGAWLHVGRVNTARRIRLCHLAGADSFDGSAATRFSTALPMLDGARRQQTLPWGEM